METLRLAPDDDDPIQSGYRMDLRASVVSLCWLLLLLVSLLQIVRLTFEFFSYATGALRAI